MQIISKIKHIYLTALFFSCLQIINIAPAESDSSLSTTDALQTRTEISQQSIIKKLADYVHYNIISPIIDGTKAISNALFRYDYTQEKPIRLVQDEIELQTISTKPHSEQIPSEPNRLKTYHDYRMQRFAKEGAQHILNFSDIFKKQPMSTNYKLIMQTDNNINTLTNSQIPEGEKPKIIQEIKNAISKLQEIEDKTEKTSLELNLQKDKRHQIIINSANLEILPDRTTLSSTIKYYQKIVNEFSKKSK